MNKFYIFIFFIVFTRVFSQSEKNKAKFKELVTTFYTEKSEKEKLKIADEYIDLANEIDSKLYLAKGNYMLATHYFDNGYNDRALYYYNRSIEFSKDLEDKSFPVVPMTEKCHLLYKMKKVNEALEYFFLTEKIALKNKNLDYYYSIKQFIAYIKSEDLNEPYEALKLMDESIKYYEGNLGGNNYKIYSELLFDKADVFKNLKQTDSASFYNKKGIAFVIKMKDNEMKVLFGLNEGANLLNTKKLDIALDSINKAINVLKKKDIAGNLMAAYFYKAKCFKLLNNKDEAAKYFIKVDSIYQIEKELDAKFSEGYPFLIQYFKEKGDTKNQLKFLTTYNTLEIGYKEFYKNTYKTIKEKYEIPYVIEEKESRISLLKIILYIFIFLLLISILVSVRFYFVNKINKEKFKKIILQSTNWQKYPLELQSGEIIEAEYQIIDEKINDNKVEIDIKKIDISKEALENILSRLAKFEKEKGFLKKQITSQSLADNFETNSKYITKVINEYKGLKVNDYINNLRIEYAVTILQKDKKLRKYSLESLADEFGFNSLDSFNRAFLRKTGLRASYFIKNLKL